MIQRYEIGTIILTFFSYSRKAFIVCFYSSNHLAKKVIVSVINDLVTDQRVAKVCQSLTNMGFEILLVGRKLKNSLPLDNRPYKTHRMRLLFTKGPLFYIEFNKRLFFLLLFKKAELLVSNDLDTLLPNYLISKIKGIPLIYDSHEYFTEVPELVNRKRVQKIWKSIECWIFPKLKNVITVNDSIADLYENEYGIRPKVVRNIPLSRKLIKSKTREELGLPTDKFILILQGSGINIDRGTEEMVEAMQYIHKAILLIVGGGDVIGILKRKVDELSIHDKVIFKPKQLYQDLMQYTANADIGLTLDKDTNLNYRFSLPNKLFDYIHAGIPVLASPLPEINKIIDHYNIGDFIPSHDPKQIAQKVNEIIENKEIIAVWKKNIKFAIQDLSWETEEHMLKQVYGKYV
jgi:glycosyltransferase involved in cell wall biosynthesis